MTAVSPLLARSPLRSLCLRAILVLTLLIAVVRPLAAGVPAPVPPPPPAPAPGVPVVFAGQTLFSVYAKLGPFTPQDRARAIVERLAVLSDDPLLRSETITALDGEQATEVLAGETVILTITEADATAAGLSRQALGKAYALKIRQALERERQETNPDALLLDAFYAGLATVLLAVLLWLLHRVFPRLADKLEACRGAQIQSVKIQRVTILSARRITDLLVGLTRMGHATLVIFLLYFYLSAVLSFFPWSRGMSAQLLSYLLASFEVIGRAFAMFVPNFISISVILLVTRYLIKLVRFVFLEIERGALSFAGFHRDWAQPTYKIVRFLMIAFAAVAIFPYIPGSESPAFRGISVFLGLLFTLGSTGAISNMVSGVVLTYMRPFQVGDRVKIADTVGDVLERTLLVTRVRTIKNVDVTIPNSSILGTHMINYSSCSQDHGLILNTTVTIGYDAPWRKVHELLIAAARSTPHIQQTPAPFVLQTSLNDFYVAYELNAYTDEPNLMATTYAELHQHIQDTFNEAGVEIMSPHYSRIRDGNRTTIPDTYLPKSYAPPAFRVEPVGSPTARTEEGSTAAERRG